MIYELRFAIVIEYFIFLREFSCSSWFIPNLKKQSQFCRSAFFVLRIAKGDLKKQSQFSKPKMDATIYKIRNYVNTVVFGLRKNKANSKPNSHFPVAKEGKLALYSENSNSLRI